MFKRYMLRVLVVLIGFVLVSSVPPPTQATVPCGWWEASVDKSVPIMGVDPPKQNAAGAKCSATFTFTNRTDTSLSPYDVTLITLIEGHSLMLQAQSGIAEFGWQSLGSPDPSKAVLVPGVELKITVSTSRPDLPDIVYIQGTWADIQVLKTDLARYLLKTMIDLIPIPSDCVFSKSALATTLMQDPDFVANMTKTMSSVAGRAINGDPFQAEQELEIASPDFLSAVVQALKGMGVSCAEKIGEDFLGSSFKMALLKIKFIDAFLTYEARWLFDYFHYQGNLAKGELVYHPIATPTPPPPACTPPPTLFDPPDGRTFWARNTILRWKNYDLKQGEYFDVQVWPEGGGMKSLGGAITHNNGAWSLPIDDLYAWSLGKYFWKVRVKASDGSYRSCDGNPFSFTLIQKDMPESPSQPDSSSSSSSSSSGFCWLVQSVWGSYIQCQ